jgi:hypothetical protein
MTEGQQPVRIAVNVMRARLTVVGFNLAIIAFQLSMLPRLPGAVQLPDLDLPLHLEAVTALLMGLGLSVIALTCFIASSAFDREGSCNHWSLLAGDLFMYLGLAQSVAAFFGPLSQLFDQVTLNISVQEAELITVRSAIVITGGFAWLFAMYVGPAVSLLRSPFGRPVTTTLGVLYVLLLFSFAHVSAQAVRLEAARAGTQATPLPSLLNELVQPLRW